MTERNELYLRIDRSLEQEWPGASALATECILNVALLADALARVGDELVVRHGIPSRAGFNVLTILDGAGEPLLPSEIARRMIVSKPTITKVTTSLERRGYIRRMPNPSDARSHQLEITAKGRDAMRSARAELHALEREIMSPLSTAEQSSLAQLIAVVRGSVEQVLSARRFGQAPT
jgi:DNA-binding MarR family transcriptional regulator